MNWPRFVFIGGYFVRAIMFCGFYTVYILKCKYYEQICTGAAYCMHNAEVTKRWQNSEAPNHLFGTNWYAYLLSYFANRRAGQNFGKCK